MNSYGELLKNAREERSLEIDNVSREITIEKRYLTALEDEDNSVFPGEAYLTGYLRSYAKYLDLDSDYILKLYHNKQLQEAPVPEGLIAKPKSRILLPAIIIPAAILVIVVAVVTVLVVNKNHKTVQETTVSTNTKKNKTIELTDKKFSQRVYKGDQFMVPTENNGAIILTVKDTLSAFGLDTPSGVYYVELSEESEIDINGDNVSDMIVYVSDISSTDETRGAEVSILLRHGIAKEVAEAVDVEEIPFASEVKSRYPQKVILEDNRAYPFTINASFRGSCLFRDKVDRADSVEAYFTKGEVFTATPRNGVRLWISNSNAVSFTIIADSKTYDLGMGSAGEILVEDIKWIKDTDGKYKLVVIELD